jgi:hypothetical protein
MPHAARLPTIDLFTDGLGSYLAYEEREPLARSANE